MNTDARFWRHVDRRGPDVCWLWLGGRYRNGYGRYRLGVGRALAHRMAWELSRGAVPSGAVVCHRCNTPPCCNPGHLFVGSIADNNRDMSAKARCRNQYGVQLSPGVLAAIRAMTSLGLRQTDIAQRVGASQALVSRVLRGERV